MRFTIDASVHLNAINRPEDGADVSRQLLAALHRPAQEPQHEVFVPTLLRVEIAAAVARGFDDDARGLALADAVGHLSHQFWVPLDSVLARESETIAARKRLRGADAVYAAVAQRFGAILVTRDRQQLERIRDEPESITPEAALQRMASPSDQAPDVHARSRHPGTAGRTEGPGGE